jgi:membrane-bound lytic murein transglycosylase B
MPMPVGNMHIAEAQSNNLTPEQEAALRSELASIEQQIKEQEAILSTKKNEGVSLERDVAILNAQIKSAQLKIQAHDIAINKLGKDITVKTNTIRTLSERIDAGKESLAQIVQRSREIDDYSMIDAMLTNQDVSEFFVDVDSYISIKASLQDRLEEIRSAKSENELAKKDLDNKRNQEIDLKVNVQAEQAKIKTAEAEKKRLLTLNKNEQQNYKTIIGNKQARAQEIRNALFKLRDVEAIKFGDAVTLAKRAAAKTGVRAAYVLAIIQQESNLGANVGQCYLTDETTGAGVKKSSGNAVSNVMKPTRDVQPFMSITKALGRDPYKTVVSCPLSVGYGGAMGPAQFIPSTWMLFQDRIAANVGRSASDPWNPEDAFMASALYLADLGAANQSYTAERNAACRYYSGRSCSGSNTFYGDQVMGRVQTIQDNIDILANL